MKIIHDMKVLVANPPAYLYDEGRCYVQGGSRWSHSYYIPRSVAKKKRWYLPYPFFLGYTASYLRAHSNADITFVDACAELMNETEFHDYVVRNNPDLVLLEVPTVSWNLIMKMLQWIKQDLPDLKVVVSGYHISGLGAEGMEKEKVIDFAISGEMELTLTELVNRDLNPANISGLIWRKGGKVVFNGIRPVDNNISDYPFPERHKHTINAYNDFALRGSPTVQMMTSRACPVGCKFCYTTVFFRNTAKHRARAPENIAEEMMYVKKEFGAKQIYFDDDTFSINPKHLQDFCNYLIKEGIDMPWTAMADITISPDNVRLMKRAGCIGLKFGVESSNPAVLKDMHKGTVSAEKTFAYRKLLRKEGIWAHATFALGHPKDTPESIKATVKFAMNLDPDSLQFSIVTPLPGTPYYRELKESGQLLTDDFSKYDGNNYSVLKLEQMSNADVESLFKYACNTWTKHIWSPSHLATFVPLCVRSRGVNGTAKLAMKMLPTLKSVVS